MSDPQSYLTIDPGRKMGWASCLRGGGDLRYGTWKYKQELPGEAYALYLSNLNQKIRSLPDVLVGVELLTIVAHVDEKGKASFDAEQIAFSAGWPTHAQTLCFRLGARPPEMIAISSWRSKTHGKVQAPRGLKQSQRTKFFKEVAFDYCHANGWSPDSDNAAEALCMLDYLRILHEPDFAFDRGRAHQQEALAF